MTESAGSQPPVWDEARANWWLANAAARERQMAPISEALFAKAALRPGERVLDVGVGAGPTTAEAYAAVQPGGSVTAIDIAAPMIEAARRRLTAPDVEWIVGDAARQEFPPETYDAVISRFGLMFFADPAAAFRRLHDATRPGGRLVTTVWTGRDSAGLFAIPYTVTTTTLHRLGVEYQPFPADGLLFSLGDPDRVRQFLGAAGWTDVDCAVDNRKLYLGGPDAAESAAGNLLEGGPVRAVVENQPDSVVAEVRTALIADLSRRVDATGIGLPGGFMVVAAVRP